ncbi:MAG TPA: cellobiose phosphorylase [Roseiarcus sp.]|nr:cellobiose phosphorylase [Roseiarcus sp.]
MPHSSIEILTTPRRGDLGLMRIANGAGLAVSLLPSGAVFAVEHTEANRRIVINQTLALPIANGMGRFYLRVGGPQPAILSMIGPEAALRVGAAEDRYVWEGDGSGVDHRVTLWLHPRLNAWFWRVEIVNRREGALSCDAILIQDLGLGDQGFLMNNEAYASQYIDHHIVQHPRLAHVLMSRQNLSQGGAHPWAAHGCLEGAAGFATDFRQVIGPASRDADQLGLPFGTRLPSERLQFETACAALQSKAVTLKPGAATSWTFFGFYLPDHPAASSDSDLSRIDAVEAASKDWAAREVALAAAPRSLLSDAPSAIAGALDDKAIRALYRRRMHVERADGQLLSFFVPGRTHSRHVVLGEKERIAARRHGALVRSGEAMLPDATVLCATAWMHGVFGAQLTIGNTSFHKLFSVSRDPYNITRGSGLRMLMETRGGWRLLTVPSAFEMGLNDCRWIYSFRERTVRVSATVSGDEPAVQWRISVEGKKCRFLVFGHLVLGELEFAHAGRIAIDARRKRFAFRPDPTDRWGRQYPEAVYHLVTSTPGRVEAIGADELLYPDGKRRSGAYAAIRTRPTNEFVFAVVGSMTDSKQAEALSSKFAKPVDEAQMLKPADRFWRSLTRGVRVRSATNSADALAVDTVFPWLAHDAMIHLTAPHGLEQYTGGAWGTRDVCQGSIELLLTLEHDRPAKEILRILFAQQYEDSGDWPQWFMLEPYSVVQDRASHGDIIVWPLKALCDYIEATGDFAFLDGAIAWRRTDNFEKTAHTDPVTSHVDKLIETVRARFIPGTTLVRYGPGDWNDSLQPVDPTKRDWMASAWTVVLLYEQLRRYAEILRHTNRTPKRARELDALAAAMRKDFNRHLVRDGIVAGYGVFRPEGGEPELLLHPSDKQTGLAFSLLPMTQGMIGGMFTQAQARRHLSLIRKHLLFSDGARLMDKPIAYHGGPETFFQRAESAAFFGREIGLMYTHSHLRYGEAMSDIGEFAALWQALKVANPITVTDELPNASLRQRNAYFSSSDAAFQDRYQASDEWGRVRTNSIAVDGGWRIYSSGPGLYANMLIRHAFGLRRRFGKRIVTPGLRQSRKDLSLEWPARPGGGSRRR